MGGSIKRVYLWLKRLLDIIVSFMGIILLLPFFLVLIIVIKIDSPGPALFKQKRFGIHNKYFYMLKFRTMRVNSPEDIPTHLFENSDIYITRVGKFLRKMSLDELPQIWNIFIGKMSIIGPRPALWNQWDLIKEREKYNVNSIRPGLTGWAQINGRDEISIEAKAKLDGEYFRELGLWMDLKCLYGTVKRVIKGDGIVEGKRLVAGENERIDENKPISK